MTGLCPIWKSLHHLSVFFRTSEAVPKELMGERFGLGRVAVGESDKANVILHIELKSFASSYDGEPVTLLCRGFPGRQRRG